MKVRVQVLLTEAERERLRRRAKADGRSLSAWILEAAMERMETAESEARIRSAKDLDAFFQRCDASERGRGAEPDWEEHLEVIRGSRENGKPAT